MTQKSATAKGGQPPLWKELQGISWQLLLSCSQLMPVDVIVDACRMSDLALPFVVAMRGDALAFWCFAVSFASLHRPCCHCR